MKEKVSVKNIFKSLLSNQAALDSRKHPWWVGVILFIFAVFLPWIPNLSQAYLANTGALFASDKNYEIDKGFKAMLESDYTKRILVQKNEKGEYYLDYQFEAGDYDDMPNAFEDEYKGLNTKALYKGNFRDILGTDPKSTATDFSTNFSKGNLSFDYYYDNIAVDTSNAIDPAKTSSSSANGNSTVVYEQGRNTYLENYFIPKISTKTEDYSTFLNNFVSSVILGVQKVGTVSEATRFPHSYAIWGSDFVLVAVYPLKSTKSSLQVAGSYSGNLNDGFVNEGESVAVGTSLSKYFTADGEITTIDAYNNNFVSFMHRAGRPAHLRQAWINVGILSAIVAGAILVGSLIVFLFFRRKTSIYRDGTFFQALMVETHMAVTPSIISMVLTFMMPQFSMVALIGANLMRFVFAMNKICPPPVGPQNSNRPLYQARS